MERKVVIVAKDKSGVLEGVVGNRVAFLDRIAVCRSERGSGVGSELMGRFIREARSAGSGMVIGVFAPEEGYEFQVTRFYEKHKFRITDVDGLPCLTRRL